MIVLEGSTLRAWALIGIDPLLLMKTDPIRADVLIWE